MNKILLVDDNPVNLKLARNILMSQYEVFTVPGAEKMMEFLDKALPDLILLDVMMPKIDGYEAIKWIKSKPKTADIPVIFLTSKSNAESELKGLSLGAVDYILKPFSPPLLLKRIEVHMKMDYQTKLLKNWNTDLKKLVDEKTGAVVKLQNAVLKTMANLVEFRDGVTGWHVERTGQFLRLLMDKMQKQGVYRDVLKTWDIDLFMSSAQLHDVGKIAISDNILLKPGSLTKEEFEEIKLHTTFGEMIIEKIQEEAGESVFLTHGKIMAGTHHEKWSGDGYPIGLVGSDIPLQGRMMAIVDVYDALVSVRPYKKAFSHTEALQIISEGNGKHFDPAITEVFLSVSEAILATSRHYSGDGIH
ncbi:response regulator [Betaproteobacteria bacterium]|nr:response regulator [Betaproteobacteria bacterium]